MSQYLVFQLYAPLVSWGEPAVGEMRHTATIPSRSALLGLLAAAVGIRRQDEQQLQHFNAGYQFAVRPLSDRESWLRDYHTVQVPKENKKRHRYTRRDELCQEPKSELETLLSDREYRCDAYYHIAVSAQPEAPFTLQQLRDALTTPVFPLYLGRKSCPPSLPFSPCLLSGNLAQIFTLAENEFFPKLERVFPQGGCRTYQGYIPYWQYLTQGGAICYWEQEGEMGITSTLSTIRKDSPLNRQRWQFGERVQHSGPYLATGGE